MPTITIRNVDEPIKARLKARAVRNGRSMEEEVRQILRAALLEEGADAINLAEVIGRRFAPFGGADLPPRPRPRVRPPATRCATPWLRF